MIRHEDTLRDHRMSYLLTLNGFLFASLAFAWKQTFWLILAIAAVGLAAGLSGFSAQDTSNRAVTKLRDLEPDASPPLVGLRGDEQDDDAQMSDWMKWWQPWKALPKVLMAIWPIIALIKILD
jgi:hypothetical protein